MPIEILMPALSPTMTEGNLAKWIKKEGESVKAGDIIAEIETDKATMEVEAVDEGVLAFIAIPDGSEAVKVGALIALILEDGESADAIAPYLADRKEKSVANIATIDPVKTTAAPQVEKTKNAKVAASPLAKRIAADNGVSLGTISGSGPHGRIVKADILKAMEGGSAALSRRNPEEYSLIKNSNIRKIIAKKLTESKQTIPHFYLSIDIRIDRLLDVRSQMNQLSKDRYKISVNDLIIKASALALRDIPTANSSWGVDAILQYNNVDISVAVATDNGLLTPIIRNADQKNIIAISGEMKALVAKAKAGKLTPEEFQGGGFSISNLGMYNIDSFRAIINPPQSCILAVGAGVQKPVVDKHGHLAVGHVMNISLSADHRVIDGAVAAELIDKIRFYLENPLAIVI